MTTEEKAMALVNEVQEFDCDVSIYHVHNAKLLRQALCRAIEQHEAFRQEVSDVVEDTKLMVETHCDTEALALVSNRLNRFIIPKSKPDPLVEVLNEMEKGRAKDWAQQGYADNFRAALDALGFEIREKGQ